MELIEKLSKKAQSRYSFYAPRDWKRRNISKKTSDEYARTAIDNYSKTKGAMAQAKLEQ